MNNTEDLNDMDLADAVEILTSTILRDVEDSSWEDNEPHPDVLIQAFKVCLPEEVFVEFKYWIDKEMS